MVTFILSPLIFINDFILYSFKINSSKEVSFPLFKLIDNSFSYALFLSSLEAAVSNNVSCSLAISAKTSSSLLTLRAAKLSSLFVLIVVFSLEVSFDLIRLDKLSPGIDT